MGFDRTGAFLDTTLDLDLFKCPGDEGPPRAAHCPDWVENSERSSFDHFGNSYAANLLMVHSGNAPLDSNSPYLRPTSRVPTPSRTLYYEENIGRWAFAAKWEIDECRWIGEGIDPGPTKTIDGWHGRGWTFNRAFVDSHAETQKIWEETKQTLLTPGEVMSSLEDGYATHYRSERLGSYPDDCFRNNPNSISSNDAYEHCRCVIIRGDGWQKDTLPAEYLPTGLIMNLSGRPSYEGCVTNGSSN